MSWYIKSCNQSALAGHVFAYLNIGEIADLLNPTRCEKISGKVDKHN